MQKRIWWIGAGPTVFVVVLATMVATSAREGESAAVTPGTWSSVATSAVPMPPPCDQMCGEEVECGEGPCRYGTDMTCGEYAELTHTASCISCASVCGEYGPCETECLESWEVTTCEEAQYECGENPPENCSSVCEESTVPCPTYCWNGTAASTCGGESYPCGDPCWTPVWEYAGVFEVPSGVDLVDCYAHRVTYQWDFCNGHWYKDLQCDLDLLLELNAPEGSCCETYWGSFYGGCGNPHGC